MNADLKEEGRKLIEKLGVHLEQDKMVPPLAGRILASLIIHHDHGITFEQLVNDLQASKSTIITHLNNLVAQKRINYFTKCGDRKKYYVIASGYIIQKINSLVSEWNKEIGLREQVIAYKIAYNKAYPKDAYPVDAEIDMKNFLQQSVSYFEEQINKYQKEHNTI